MRLKAIVAAAVLAASVGCATEPHGEATAYLDARNVLATSGSIALSLHESGDIDTDELRQFRAIYHAADLAMDEWHTAILAGADTAGMEDRVGRLVAAAAEAAAELEGGGE